VRVGLAASSSSCWCTTWRRHFDGTRGVTAQAPCSSSTRSDGFRIRTGGVQELLGVLPDLTTLRKYANG
jgi:hypothetical protein